MLEYNPDKQRSRKMTSWNELNVTAKEEENESKMDRKTLYEHETPH